MIRAEDFKFLIDFYNELGVPSQAENLELLLSSNPDAVKVVEWLERNNDKKRNHFLQKIAFLADKLTSYKEIDAWEGAPMKDRISHSRRVTKLARELAAALDEDIRPTYPPALELFDEERAIDIMRALSSKWYFGHLSTKAKKLSRRFLSPDYQRLQPMLKRLAIFSEEATKAEQRDKRPSFPNANARAFARQLAGYFKQFYDRTPNEIIAACVCLKFPEIDPVPDESTIRAWRGAK